MQSKKLNDAFDKLHKLPISRSGDRAPRIAIVLAVHLSTKQLINGFECETINISRTGILISACPTLSKSIIGGQIVSLKIDLNRNYFPQEIFTPAEVIRVTPSSNSHKNCSIIALRFCKFLDQ